MFFPQVGASLFLEWLPGAGLHGSLQINSTRGYIAEAGFGMCGHNPQVFRCVLALVRVRLERISGQIRLSYKHLSRYQGLITFATVTDRNKRNQPRAHRIPQQVGQVDF